MGAPRDTAPVRRRRARCARSGSPSNIVSTVGSVVDAIFSDGATVGRLVSKCFGQYGSPVHVQLHDDAGARVARRDRDALCTSDDPFSLLVPRIEQKILMWIEMKLLKLSLSDQVVQTSFIHIKFPLGIPDINWQPDRRSSSDVLPVCDAGPSATRSGAAISRRRKPARSRVRSKDLAKVPTCYYSACTRSARTATCSTAATTRSSQKFSDADDLHAQFAAAFEDSFATEDPALDLVLWKRSARRPRAGLKQRRTYAAASGRFCQRALPRRGDHRAAYLPWSKRRAEQRFDEFAVRVGTHRVQAADGRFLDDVSAAAAAQRADRLQTLVDGDREG